VGIKLSVELVPSSCWFSNVRSEVSAATWKKLRQQTLEAASHSCEVCGDSKKLECHEIFNYDDANHTQTLVRLQCLCKACHSVKHLGLAFAQNREQPALRRLARLNSWSSAKTDAYVQRVFALWQERSTHEWRLDLGSLW